MKKTNYDDVAERYDRNEDRHRIARDEALGAILGARAPSSSVTVLDLGCGTGNYLAVQSAHFADPNVRWVGVDPSAAMLDRAQGKAPRAELILGGAEHLPFAAGEVDYVVVRFALHHFEDKALGLDEIARVLKPTGFVRLTDIAPTYMPGWWVYRFFPSVWHDDQERFWPPQRVFAELEERGLRPNLHVDYQLSYLPIRTVLDDVIRRELSELVIIDEAAYAAGLAQVRRRAETNPRELGTSEVAVADLIGSRENAVAPAHWP